MYLSEKLDKALGGAAAGFHIARIPHAFPHIPQSPAKGNLEGSGEEVKGGEIATGGTTTSVLGRTCTLDANALGRVTRVVYVGDSRSRSYLTLL